ncbi:uncharacterized protein [Nicotiana sylvestris]|uniref:uncharacterized protein n=1 Tax=Nicotiana sylvestris TaxID=4096 RepID=UPI00388CC50D
MTELVGSHTASIQKLEMKMRNLSREQNPKQKGTLPNDVIVNPKGSGSGPTSHCMAITTQSEKVPEELKVQEVNREEVKENVKGMPKTLPPIPRPPPPFLQRLARRGFSKYLKDLITNNEVVNVICRVSSIIATTTVQKKKDTGAFTIPCTIGARNFARVLCDNRDIINLMPLDIYKQVGLGMPRTTSMRLQMADRSTKRPVGIVDDVLVKVGKFHLPTNFVILDCAVDKETPIILGRLFLATERVLMD